MENCVLSSFRAERASVRMDDRLWDLGWRTERVFVTGDVKFNANKKYMKTLEMKTTKEKSSSQRVENNKIITAAEEF